MDVEPKTNSSTHAQILLSRLPKQTVAMIAMAAMTTMATKMMVMLMREMQVKMAAMDKKEATMKATVTTASKEQSHLVKVLANWRIYRKLPSSVKSHAHPDAVRENCVMTPVAIRDDMLFIPPLAV